MTIAQDTVGHILTSIQGRDAIHVPVLSVLAQVRLSPGEDVGADGTRNDPIGIVDPFLTKRVEPGEIFWLFIYPRTISTLRHVWDHPKVSSEFGVIKSNNGKLPIKEVNPYTNLPYTREQELALDSIKNYSDEIGIDDPHTLIQAGLEYIESGEYLCLGGLLEGLSTEYHFWDNLSVLVGKEIKNDNRGNFFTCSC